MFNSKLNYKPLISVVMPVYNETISEINSGIESIINQTYKHFELVIIDDNPDNKLIKYDLQRLSEIDDRIKVIYHNVNLGLVISENDGIKRSSGKYIARADADDISCKTRLATQYRFLIDNHLDLTSCNNMLVNMRGHVIKHHLFSTITQCNQNKIRKAISYCNIMSGSNLFFKKDVFYKINGYRINLVDDYDFVSRVLIYGDRIGYQAKNLVIKKARYNSISDSKSIEQFIYTCIISKYLRHFKYTKIPSLSCFNNKLNNINKYDSQKYVQLLKYKKMFNRNKSIGVLIKMILIIISSKIILKKILWGKLVFDRQNFFLR